MKKFVQCLNFYMLTVIPTFSQAPQKLWESFYNGALLGKDVSNSVVTDNVGNVYITGICYQSIAQGNFTTVKYDINGVQQWSDHYNNAGTGAFNGGKKIVIDKHQNLYAIGTVASNDGDIAVVKYNSSGKLWSSIYEPYWFGSDYDFGVDIAVDTLDNFYATGQVTSLSGNLFDSYFMKCDSDGTKIFEENFTSASGDDYPAGVAVTSNGNFFALSNSYNFFGSSTYDIFTINYLANGNQNWISRYNNPLGNSTDHGTFIIIDQSNNQYICGTTAVVNNNDMVVLKQNNYGTRLWVSTYNGTANGNDTAVSTSPLPNGFVVVTGKTKELLNGNNVDAIVTMLIDSGTTVWTNKFFGVDSIGATPAQMITDAQGNIYICGYESLTGGAKNGCIIKYDSNGNLIWNITYDAGLNLDDKFNSIVLDSNSDLLVSGQTFTSAINSSFLTVKYSNSVTGVQQPEKSIGNILLYPNPAQDKATLLFTLKEIGPLEIYITDIAGREIKPVARANEFIGSGKIDFDISDLYQGVYFVVMKSRSEVGLTKLLVGK